MIKLRCPSNDEVEDEESEQYNLLEYEIDHSLLPPGYNLSTFGGMLTGDPSTADSTPTLKDLALYQSAIATAKAKVKSI